MNDVLFREAKKRWLSEQPDAVRSEYYARAKELNDGKTTYFEREEILNEEFGITRDTLSDMLEKVSEEWKERRREKREAAEERSEATESPDGVPESAPDGGSVASNDVSNIKWVAENLPNEGTLREHAPCSAAWGLLCWARRNPDQFYTQIYKQVVIPTKREIEEAIDASEDETRLIVALDKVRAIAGDLVDG